MELKNKVAIITGGASGLGRATAIRYARSGANVIVADTNISEGEKTAELIRGKKGTAEFVHTDVTSENDVINMMDVVKGKFAKLDVLVTCAGILLSPNTRVDQFEVVDWDRVIDVNLKGTFLCVKHAVSLMVQPSGGIILMIASGAGVLGGSSSVAYAASKGGVHGFGLTLAGQLKPLNIRVHVILPGNMATTLKLNVIGEIAEKAGESRKGAIKAQLPGLLKPEITAELLTNLVSDIGTSAQDTLLIQSADWAKIFEDQKRST